MTERLPQNYTPTNYDFYLHIIKDQNHVNAQVTITFQKNQDDNKIYLNIGPFITINKITQNDIDLDFTTNSSFLIIYHSKNSEISFETKPITIFYSIQLNIHPKEKRGLYVFNDNYLTHLEPTNARNLLPCFDEPCIRSTFSIKLRIPTNLTAISNMPIESIESKENEPEKEVTFITTPPICTYLVCVCVGTFSSIQGTSEKGAPIEYFTKFGNEKFFQKYRDAAIYAFNWMESKFQVKYELPRLQLISLEGCPPGMENYGLITLPDYSIHTNYIQNVTVIMHEVIHQWFGNLVSIKYWDSLWLKEGFAQFIQYLILNDYLPESNAFKIFAFNDGMKCINNYFDSGRIIPKESEIDFDNLFDSLVYSKGSYVVKMFCDLIGIEKFDKVCSNYLDKFKFESVDLNEFVSFVNSFLNDDYSSFFHNWLKNVGFPVLTIREIADNIGINIVQLRQGENLYKFKVPIIYSKNGEIKKIEVIISNYITQAIFDFDRVLVNDNFSSLCFVIYTKKLLSCLINAENKDEINILNKMIISKAIQSECAPFIIDDEMIQMAENFK